mgnify:CR=1 FL=1
MDIPEHHALNSFARQPGRVNPVQLFLLQRREKALHARVVIAPPDAAHALNELMAFECQTVLPACELAAPVGVEYCALHNRAAAGILQGLDAQRRAHIVVHVEAAYAAVKAIQHCGQIEFAVRAGYFGNIRQQLFVRLFGCEVSLDDVCRLFCLAFGFGDAVGASAPDGQLMLTADAVDTPVTACVTAVEPEPRDDTTDAVVVAVLLILAQALVDLLQQQTLALSLVRAVQGTVVALLADV